FTVKELLHPVGKDRRARYRAQRLIALSNFNFRRVLHRIFLATARNTLQRLGKEKVNTRRGAVSPPVDVHFPLFRTTVEAMSGRVAGSPEPVFNGSERNRLASRSRGYETRP